MSSNVLSPGRYQCQPKDILMLLSVTITIGDLFIQKNEIESAIELFTEACLSIPIKSLLETISEEIELKLKKKLLSSHQYTRVIDTVMEELWNNKPAEYFAKLIYGIQSKESSLMDNSSYYTGKEDENSFNQDYDYLSDDMGSRVGSHNNEDMKHTLQASVIMQLIKHDQSSLIQQTVQT
eukprot:gene16147-21949_t